jgi:hypothetical protein
MLREVDYGDWYFYMDAEWYGQWNDDTKELLLENDDQWVSAKVYVLRKWAPSTLDTNGNSIPDLFTYPYFACFRNQRGLHYCYNHCSLHDGDGLIVHKRDDWKVIDPRIGWEELGRKDYIERQSIKRRKFREGVITELSDGNGWLICSNCGYGRYITYPSGAPKGFNIPRGMPMLCPDCGSGDVINAINQR